MIFHARKNRPVTRISFLPYALTVASGSFVACLITFPVAIALTLETMFIIRSAAAKKNA